jgi:Leucine-rich repeat (LRR) protein
VILLLDKSRFVIPVINSIGSSGFQMMVNIKQISLMSNKLTIVPSGLFNGLSTLKVIKLSKNWISSVSNNAFIGTGITNLDLSSNKITDIPTEVLQQVSGNDNPIELI